MESTPQQCVAQRLTSKLRRAFPGRPSTSAQRVLSGEATAQAQRPAASGAGRHRAAGRRLEEARAHSTHRALSGQRGQDCSLPRKPPHDPEAPEQAQPLQAPPGDTAPITACLTTLHTHSATCLNFLCFYYFVLRIFVSGCHFSAVSCILKRLRALITSHFQGGT